MSAWVHYMTELSALTLSAVGALRAARPIIEQRRGAAEVFVKAPNDIVTSTDILVQKVIQRTLHEHAPDISFRGEEGTHHQQEDARRKWLVDPVCGTNNYASGLPLFSTNIALVEDGVITSSAVADGGTGQIFVAERGRGAWRVDDASLTPLHVAADSRTLSVDPDLYGRAGIADFPTTFALRAIEARQWHIRVVGSTLALLHVATGSLAAAVYTPGPDALHVAAGALLALEAGAVLTDHEGAPWTIGQPVLIAAASARLQAELQSLAARVYAELSSDANS